MKKLIAGLFVTALAGALVSLAIDSRSEAQQGGNPIPVIKVECDGSGCGGSGNTASGPREFVYHVKVPGGNYVSCTSVEIGVDMSDLPMYTNLVKPPGWIVEILAASPTHALATTPHGSTSTPGGTCEYVLKFSGPAMTSHFTLGYDYDANFEAHDANWKVNNNVNRADWTKPVGLGQGPVHSPYPS
ncbi:MAG: hypothetical protein EPO68_11775 [Planctomycetota bacterium]|nr:MAG: hypothetical protein EPO68_11775 [Planctomycetota bacterium]